MTGTEFEPKIISFFCQWCADAAADAAGRSRIALPPNLRVVRVMCSGRVAPEFILQAFAAGADGVLVAGCLDGSCHYKNGNVTTLKRMAVLKTVLTPLGIDSERVRRAGIGADDAKGLARVVSDLVETVRRLGPQPRSE